MPTAHGLNVEDKDIAAEVQPITRRRAGEGHQEGKRDGHS